ncbi:hypothetical protein ACWENQ_37380 [Nonomuraea sp. NPDC004354]
MLVQPVSQNLKGCSTVASAAWLVPVGALAGTTTIAVRKTDAFQLTHGKPVAVTLAAG